MNSWNDPILVTGAHRSGSTWVGRMLCAGNEAFYIHEPFNNVRPTGPVWLPKRFPYWFYYLSGDGAGYAVDLDRVVQMHYPVGAALACARSPRQYGRAFRDWLQSWHARRMHKRPLLKDPIALFSAEWIANRYDANVVVLIRHPAAFAASLIRADWWFKFSNWLNQEALIRERLPEYAEAIRAYPLQGKSLLRQAILMWNCMYSVVAKYQQRHPDWIFVRQEDLASNPINRFQDLYRRLGLAWNTPAERTLVEYSNDHNSKETDPIRPGMIRRDSKATVTSWRTRLSPEDMEEIREGTRNVADRFYSKDEW